MSAVMELKWINGGGSSTDKSSHWDYRYWIEFPDGGKFDITCDEALSLISEETLQAYRNKTSWDAVGNTLKVLQAEINHRIAQCGLKVEIGKGYADLTCTADNYHQRIDTETGWPTDRSEYQHVSILTIFALLAGIHFGLSKKAA